MPSPKKASRTVDAAPLKVLWPETYSGKLGVVKSGSQVASAITPVPGGVGPMTIAMLLQNTLQAMQQAALD